MSFPCFSYAYHAYQMIVWYIPEEIFKLAEGPGYEVILLNKRSVSEN